MTPGPDWFLASCSIAAFRLPVRRRGPGALSGPLQAGGRWADVPCAMRHAPRAGPLHERLVTSPLHPGPRHPKYIELITQKGLSPMFHLTRRSLVSGIHLPSNPQQKRQHQHPHSLKRLSLAKKHGANGIWYRNGLRRVSLNFVVRLTSCAANPGPISFRGARLR
jgi:hypothetical protein